MNRPFAATLTEREWALARLAAQGHPYKEIGGRRASSSLSNAFVKTGARNIVHLIALLDDYRPGWRKKMPFPDGIRQEPAMTDRRPFMPGPSIAIVEGSELRYQGAVTFDTEVTANLKGWEYPMVYVAAYQDDVLVYGQLDYPTATFILGGGSSPWVSKGGGAAHCIATLYSYPGLHKGDIKYLASCEFEAAA